MSRGLTEVQMHYVRSFKDEKTPKELAEILKISVRRVNTAIEKINAEPETPPGKPPKDDFARDKGAVSMTAEQGQKEDSDREHQTQTPGEKFMNSRLKGCVGQVYPNKDS